MKNGIYTWAIFMAFLALSESGYAVIPVFAIADDITKRVVIYFDKEETVVDPFYKDNNQGINLLDSLLDEKMDSKYITALNVVTFVSPDGDSDYNTELSVRRNNSMRAFLQQRYPYIDIEKIKLVSEGEDWSEFRRLVAADSDLPDREEVLMLIDYHRDNIVKRKQLLQKLNQGIAYRYIVRNVLPKLRRSVITVVREVPEADTNTFELASSASGLFVSKKEEETLPDNQFDKPLGESKNKRVCEVVVSGVEESVESKTVLAVKNNLLYDLVLAPNIEVEIPVGKRWSLNAEYKCPWWLNSKHDFCYQLLSGGVEGRYWLGNRQQRNRLTGHFVGVYAEGGIYDFQFSGDGYHGKYYGAAGVTYGYARQLARHLSFEFSLGIGYLTTEYKKYTPYEEDIVWTNSGRYNFIGPTKAKISLVWLITTRR